MVHGSLVSGSKTYRVYARVEDDIKNGRLTQRAVAVYLSWLLEKALSDLHACAGRSGGLMFCKEALDNIQNVYYDICKTREGSGAGIGSVLVQDAAQHLEKLRVALFYLVHGRNELLPLEGTQGEDIARFSSASGHVASAMSIIQANLNLPDVPSENTRNRSCLLVDSLVDSISSIPDVAFTHAVQDSYGFTTQSGMKYALLMAAEELRCVVHTMHQDVDLAARQCVRDSFETLLNVIGRALDAVSRTQQGGHVGRQALWSCMLARRAMSACQGAFSCYVSDTSTRDCDLSDNKYLLIYALVATTCVRRLMSSCLAITPGQRPLDSFHRIVQCSIKINNLYMSLDRREGSGVTDGTLVAEVLPVLNEVRETIDQIDPSVLPGERDAEVLRRLRDAVLRASERCILRQCAEPDLLDPAPGIGWDALSVEGLEDPHSAASRGMLH